MFALLQMCNIPFLNAQLDLLLMLRELPVSMNDLQPVSPRHPTNAERTSTTLVQTIQMNS